jgi:hypothetical protein
MKKFNFLEKVYIFLVILILLLAGFTPLLVQDGFYFLTEELIEVILVFFLLAIGGLIIFLLKRESEKNRLLAQSATESLAEAFKHIGKTNIYFKEAHSIISGLKHYPESRKDFKRTLRLMAEKILSIVEADYVWLKVIDEGKSNILSELFVARGDRDIPPPAVSSRALLENSVPENFSFFSAEAENVSARVFAVLPALKFSAEQAALIKAVLNQTQMIFLIFSSGYYKNGAGEADEKAL